MKSPQLYTPSNNPSARRRIAALEDQARLLDEEDAAFDPHAWARGFSRPSPALMEEHSIFAHLNFY